MSAVEKDDLVKTSPVNPRTGRTWSLADPEVAAIVADMQQKALQSKSSAVAALRRTGIVTAKGKLTKTYGG